MASLSRRYISAIALLVVVSVPKELLPLASARRQAPASANGPGGRMVSRADAIADLDALFRTIENIHPNPYWSRSRESVESDRRRLLETLPDAMTREEWWMRLSPLVASLDDGHTLINPPERRSEPGEALEIARQFPPRSVGLDDAGHVLVTVTTLATDGLQRGDRILTINGRSMDLLVADWIRETSGDSEAFRAALTMARFHLLLAVHSILPPYALMVAGADGRERSVSFAGTPVQATTLATTPTPGPQNFAYRTLQPAVGFMSFYSMKGDLRRFKKDIGGMFRQVAADSVRTLIVDLRGNGGGNWILGNEMLRYVTTKPYRNYSQKELKRSRELRDYASTVISPPFRWWPLKYLFADTRRQLTGRLGTLATWPKPELKTPTRAEPFFSGPVCVLTGPLTFSAAAVFADTVKTYRLATIVGVESGGRPMFGDGQDYKLPRSGLQASIAAGRIVRANGNASDPSGVVPDIVVKTTAADIREGRDPVLERARNCLSIQ